MFPKGYLNDTLIVPLTNRFNKHYLPLEANGKSPLYFPLNRLAPVHMAPRRNAPGQKAADANLPKHETGPVNSWDMLKGGSYFAD